MASRRYNSLNFIYTDDFGIDTLKIQREFKNENGNPFIEVTSTFRERQVDIPEKVETNFNGENLRRLIAYTNATESNNTSALSQFLPYNTFGKITQHIKEILQDANVICGDYRGENSGNQRRLNQQ